MAFGINAGALANLAQSAGKGGGGGALDTVLGILGSKGGQTAVNAVGAGLSAYGAHKDAEANRAQTAGQFQANLAQRQDEMARDDQRQRAVAGNNANPLGTEQGFAQKQAILGAILGNSRNLSITPGDPAVAAAKGTATGGLRLPEGGFDPEMIERLFGNSTTLASLKQHGQQVGQINPNAPVMDLSTLYGQPGGDVTSAVGASNLALQAKLDEESRKRQEVIRRAIEQDVRGEKAPSKGSKAKGALGGAASGAMAGAALGPWGMAGGAILGGLKGLFS